MTDERGSVVSITDSAGATININAYDEYGIPAPTNLGRFGYTGQTWLPEVGMWYYKARMYSPTLGRFMQTDPIGYADGMNWYNYVGSDPVNFGDPLGLGAIVVTATKSVCLAGNQQVPDKRQKSGFRCEPIPAFKVPNEVSEGGGGPGGDKPQPKTVITCGIQPGFCKKVSYKEYCAAVKGRLKLFAVAGAGITAANGYKATVQISGSSLFSRGLGAVQLAVAGETVADLIDQALYCEE